MSFGTEYLHKKISKLEDKIEEVKEWKRKWYWSLNVHCPSASFALDEILEDKN